MATNISSTGVSPGPSPQQLAEISQGLADFKEVIDSAGKLLAEQAKALGAGPELDELLRMMAANPPGMLTGTNPLFEDFGGTAVSLPAVAAPGDMGSLSTADLLQLLRTESRKTTELLMAATMQAIKTMQADIQANSDSSIAKLMDAARSQDKAEKMQAAMKVVKWVAVAAAVIIGAAAVVVSSGAALPLVMAAVSLALMIGTTALGEIKDDEGVSVMDKAMKGLAKGMQGLSEKLGELPDWAQWAVVGVAAAAAVALAVFVDPKLLSVTLPMVAAMTVSALPDSVMNEEQKAQAMASILMIGTMVALSVYAAGASASAASAGSQVFSAATMSAARMTVTAGTAVQGLLQMVQGGMQIGTAVAQYNADKAQADVMALQELVKMMQTLLDSDSNFIQMLADIQAQLDAGVANVISLEHQTNEKIDTEAFS